MQETRESRLLEKIKHVNEDELWIDKIWENELHGGLWHSTSDRSFRRIMCDGEIRPNPDLQGEIVETGNGARGNASFVQSMGGVSLFDFRSGDFRTHKQEPPPIRWENFITDKNHSTTGLLCAEIAAIWIEVDFEVIHDQFLSVEELRERWDANKCYGKNWMRLIEAAYIGSIPKNAFKRAIAFAQHKRHAYRTFSISSYNEKQFDRMLKELDPSAHSSSNP